MGLNINLVQMLGVPAASTCPTCKKSFDNNFDVYDIECGFPNTKKGTWRLNNYCPYCEHEFVENFIVVPFCQDRKP